VFEDDKNVNPDVDVCKPYVEHIISFMMQIAVDPERTDSLVGASCGLLGDICTTFGAPMIQAVDNPTFTDLLQEGRRSKIDAGCMGFKNYSQPEEVR
jgi:importin subunit beta-1